METLSPQQQKIYIVGMGILAGIVLLWAAFYFPLKKQTDEMKSELNSLQAQIRGIESMVDTSKTVQERIKIFQQRFDRIDQMFPANERPALKALADIAKQSDTDIVSMRAQPKTPFLDVDQNPVEVDGKKCMSVRVTIDAQANYRDIVTYLQKLRENMPAYMMVHGLRLTRHEKGGEEGMLNATIDIDLYLLTL